MAVLLTRSISAICLSRRRPLKSLACIGYSSCPRRNRRSRRKMTRPPRKFVCGCCAWRWQDGSNSRLIRRKSGGAEFPMPSKLCAIMRAVFPGEIVLSHRGGQRGQTKRMARTFRVGRAGRIHRRAPARHRRHGVSQAVQGEDLERLSSGHLVISNSHADTDGTAD